MDGNPAKWNPYTARLIWVSVSEMPPLISGSIALRARFRSMRAELASLDRTRIPKLFLMPSSMASCNESFSGAAVAVPVAALP